jgi:hypothetical protein
MHSWSPALALGLPVVLLGFLGGCASGAHSTASRPPATPAPVYLAPLTCWDTVSCCVERNPFTAVESCGADPSRVASILKTLADAYATMESTPVTEAAPTAEGTETSQTGEQAETAAGQKDGMPAWKRRCILTYVRCQQERWVGNCHDCFRRCEGQRRWPQHMCPDPLVKN